MFCNIQVGAVGHACTTPDHFIFWIGVLRNQSKKVQPEIAFPLASRLTIHGVSSIMPT